MRKIALVLIVVSLLSGCIDLKPVKPGTSGGNVLYGSEHTIQTQNEQYSIDIVGDTQANSERIQKILNFISTKYNQIDKIALDVTTTSKWNDFVQVKKQKNQEMYQDGMIQKYVIDSNIVMNDQKVEEKIFYNGEKYYINFNNLNWEEVNSDTKASTIYLYLIKLLLEGSDKISVEDGLENVVLKRSVTNNELVDSIYQMIDIPFMLTKNATKQITLEYQVEEETGNILVANVKLFINDLGQSYSIDMVAKTDEKVVFDDLAIDTSVTANTVETDNIHFADYFKAANPYELINYYELYKNEVDGEKIKATLGLGNYINGNPRMTVTGDILENEMINFGLITNNQLYRIESDHVQVVDTQEMNLYAYFVNRAIEQYESLQLVESSEEVTETYTLRELYEYDFESFAKAVGNVDVTHIQKEGDAAYGVDYIIDSNTQQLTAVYLWSTLIGEESVSTLITLNFNKLNAHNPNFVTANVDEKIWDQLTE